MSEPNHERWAAATLGGLSLLGTGLLSPGWVFGKYPNRRMIFGTYAQDFATTWGRKVRNLIQSQEHRAVFPDSRVSDDSKAADHFTTPEGGEYTAAGRGVERAMRH